MTLCVTLTRLQTVLILVIHLSTADLLSTLKQVHVIFRHGDRTPIGPTFPSDHYNDLTFWPPGWGQLTEAGEKAQYEFGCFLRTRYDGFLPKQYSIGQVYVTSSDIDRAVASALINLAGLYESDELMKNECKWQKPIPIHTLHSRIDNKINFIPSNCPKYKLRLEQLLESEFVQRINAHYHDLYVNLTFHTGRTVHEFIAVSEIYDALIVQKQNGMKLPEWTKTLFPTKMEPLAILPFDLISFTHEMTRLRAGPLLYEILYRMEVASGLVQLGPSAYEAFPKAKLYMYSGHDTTVVSVLAGFGLYDRSHIPPYTAAVIIELHEEKVGENTLPVVKVFYRNNSEAYPPRLKIPGCSNAGEITCPLTELKKVLSDITLSEGQFISACEVTKEDAHYTYPLPDAPCLRKYLEGNFDNHSIFKRMSEFVSKYVFFK